MLVRLEAMTNGELYPRSGTNSPSAEVPTHSW